jgi:predicted nucleic acid-binding Zn ribbon protein
MSKICQVCGSKFDPIRLDAKYCSNNCRQKKHRNRNRVTQKPVSILLSNGSTLHEHIDLQLENFYSKTLIPLTSYHWSSEIFLYLARDLGVEKEIYQTDYTKIDTPEKSKKHAADSEKLRNIIIDKWHNGTDKEKKAILRHFIQWGLAGNSEIFDLFWNLYSS